MSLNTFNVSVCSCSEAGYDEQTVRQLEQHFNKLIEQNNIECASYLLAREGKVFAMGASGRLSFEDEASKYKLDSIRKLASITKLFTAVAIFQLIEQGKIHLRQGVAEWIEEFNHPMFNKINILHLLTHTSGLQADPFYFLEPYPLHPSAYQHAYEPRSSNEQSEEQSEKLEQQRRVAWIKAILALKPQCNPGEQWNYSTSGYRILGEIIARASQQSYEDYVMTHIIKPLRLERTFFIVPDDLKKEVCIINEFDKERLNSKPSSYNPHFAGGGLYSTTLDLFRFGQMLINNGSLDGVQILSRKSVEKLSANILDDGIPAFSWGGRIKNKTYGLGPLLVAQNEWINEQTYGHEGAGRSILLLDPTRQAVIIFFVPSNVDWCPESMIGTQNIIGAGWL